MFTKEILDNMRDLVTSLSADCGAARDETGSEDDHRPIGGAIRSSFRTYTGKWSKKYVRLSDSQYGLTESADAGTPRDAAKAASALTRCGPT